MKELRLAGICDMSAGHEFLPTFIERFNEKFALPAAKGEKLHRTLNMHREQRHVSQQLSLALGTYALTPSSPCDSPVVTRVTATSLLTSRFFKLIVDRTESQIVWNGYFRSQTGALT